MLSLINEETREDFGLDEGDEPTDGFGITSHMHRVEMPRQARYRFNQDPKATVKWLADQKGAALAIGAPELARWFLTEEGLSTKKIGEWLGGPAPLQCDTLRAFVGALQFKALPLDKALRYFLSLFKLPGEAQQIDRIMQAFADRWAEENGAAEDADGGPLSAETAYVLAFSLIMLNTDLHSDKIESKMSKEQFVRNNRGIGPNGSDVPRETLEALYEAIAAEEIQIEQREYIRGTAREGWLSKQGGRVKTWKKRWVILSGSVLYYFDSPKELQPKGLVPLEQVIVRTSQERPFSFMLSCSLHAGGILKSAKAKADGAMHQGHHTAFLFAAENAAEREGWVRAINENILCNRMGQMDASNAPPRTLSAPTVPNTPRSNTMPSLAQAPAGAPAGASSFRQ